MIKRIQFSIVFCIILNFSFGQQTKLKTFEINDFECHNSFTAGTTNTLIFTMTPSSEESEYIDQVMLVFPKGFIVVQASDSIAGEDLEYFSGDTVVWGDNDNYIGGILPNEKTYKFSVSVQIDPSVTGNQLINYIVSGDEYGKSAPHERKGTIPLKTSKCGEAQTPITVSVFTDKFPGETRWYLTNVNETKTYMSAVDLYDTAYTLYSNTACIDALDTVKFVIEDNYGDGICCLNGSGYYTVETPCEVIKHGAKFNQDEDTTFVVKFINNITYNFIMKNIGPKNDEGHTVTQTCDGGLLVTGMSENLSKGGYDAYALKLDGMGKTEWIKNIGTSDNEAVYNSIQTSDDGYLILGNTYPQDKSWSNGLVIKINKKGQIEWQKSLGSAEQDTYDVCTDAIELDTTFIVVGKQADLLTIYLFNQKGELLSSKKEKASYTIGDEMPLIKKRADGTMFIAYMDSYDLAIKTIDSSGVVLEKIELPVDDIALSHIKVVKVLPSDQILVAGYDDGETGNYRMKYVILNKDYTVATSHMLENASEYDEYITDATMSGDTILIAGYRGLWNFNESDWDSIVTVAIKVKTDGTIIWNHQFLTDNAKTWSRGITLTSDNGFAMTGYIQNLKGKHDTYVIRANSDGFVNAVYQNEAICMVTVDPSTGKNLITWEKTPNEGTQSFNIYKETNVAETFELIGNVPFSNISTFVDLASNSFVHADRYKISSVNSFGLESRLSQHHKTMHLTINKGNDDKIFNLIWDGYEGFTYSTYNVYRGTSPDNMVLIASLPNSLTSFTDIQAPINKSVYYQVSVVKLNPCVPNAKVSSKSDSGPFSQSLSNLAESELTDAQLVEEEKPFCISPNPATDYFAVSATNANDLMVDVVIYSENGLKVYENFVSINQNIPLTQLNSGVYVVQITGQKNIVRYKLVKK